MENQAQL